MADSDEINQPETNFRVRLRNSTNTREMVSFFATPDLIEARQVNYKMMDPVHAPGQIAAYQNTNSRNFNISQIRLISRTPQEAEENLARLWILRSWTMPQFGTSTLNSTNRSNRNFLSELALRDPDSLTREDRIQQSRAIQGAGVELRGRPPAVLLFSAYSTDEQAGGEYGSNKVQQTGHINRVPVVMQNISIPYPSDVDYIPTAINQVPMPTIMTLDMTLIETHSPREYERFDLLAFKQGRLPGY